MRHADASNSDTRIELPEELSLERILASEFGLLTSYFTAGIDPQFENELLIECRGFVSCSMSCSPHLSGASRRSDKRWLIAGPHSPRLAARVRGGYWPNQASRVQTGSAEFLIARAIRRQRRDISRVSGLSPL